MGVELAADSEKSLKAIVENTNRVFQLIQEVAQGSQEQSHGIDQVKQAAEHQNARAFQQSVGEFQLLQFYGRQRIARRRQRGL